MKQAHPTRYDASCQCLRGVLPASPSRACSQEGVLRCITDPSEPVSAILGPQADLQEEQMSHVLALRGLLACNLLTHCLQRRPRVDFGVSRYVCTSLAGASLSWQATPHVTVTSSGASLVWCIQLCGHVRMMTCYQPAMRTRPTTLIIKQQSAHVAAHTCVGLERITA